MFHLEHDESRHLLLVASDSVTDVAQIDGIRDLMKARGLDRGILRDLFNPKEFFEEMLRGDDSHEATRKRFRDVVWECFFLEAVLLIPRISPFLRGEHFGRLFAFSLVSSGLPFFAFDRPELTQLSLIHEIRSTGKPLDADSLDYAAKFAKKSAKSRNIRKALDAARGKGVRLGNPRIADARAKARMAHEAARPSKETVNLIAKLKLKGESVRAIARTLNEEGIKPPRGQQWYASSIKNQLL
jgi:hypothetical protein